MQNKVKDPVKHICNKVMNRFAADRGTNKQKSSAVQHPTLHSLKLQQFSEGYMMSQYCTSVNETENSEVYNVMP